jgi:hypothetical protein
MLILRVGPDAARNPTHIAFSKRPLDAIWIRPEEP